MLTQSGIPVLYSGDGTRRGEYSFAVPYRDESGDHPLVTSAEELFRQMAADPKGSYRLSEDLDASGLSDAAAAVAGTFTGELDGNGYKILNLPTSLFHTLSGAYIHDLVIENAQITTSRTGILANTIQNGAVVERVFLVDSSISNGVDGLGAFAGSLNNAAIRESASIGVSVKGLVAVGGIVGQTRAGAVIENCYVTGRVQGTYDHPSLGARVGGMARRRDDPCLLHSGAGGGPGPEGQRRPHRRAQYRKPGDREQPEHELRGGLPHRGLRRAGQCDKRL